MIEPGNTGSFGSQPDRRHGLLASMRPDSITDGNPIEKIDGRIELFEATPVHVRALLPRLREDDKNEIEAAGISCKRALWRSWKGSHLRVTATVDGDIAAMWGCGGMLLGAEGRPWLLTAPPCEKVPVAFIRIGRAQAARMLELHETLRGLVHAEYYRAVRTLSLMGFRLGPAVKLNGADFLEFSMGRNHAGA